MITQERLKKLVHYDPHTGLFTRRVKASRNTNIGDVIKCRHPHGYIQFWAERNMCQAHRMAFLYMLGHIPEYVDHINGVRNDNRWVNLRPATKQQNNLNRVVRHDSKTGIKGVHWHKKNRKWIAYVNHDGKRFNLGSFYDLISAELAVKKKRNELHGEFSNNG